MQRVGARDETELLHQLTGRRNGLRTDARAARVEIVWLDLRNQAAQRLAKQIAAERAAQLEPGGGGIAPEETPEAAVGECVEEIARVEIGFAISFARRGQDRIGSGFDAAANQAREVHAEEGEARIGHGVDE